jgi:hypothetical protein
MLAVRLANMMAGQLASLLAVWHESRFPREISPKLRLGKTPESFFILHEPRKSTPS